MKNENEIIFVSTEIEIHPGEGDDWAVVRNGAVYGTYPSIRQAAEIADGLADAD
ncbi:MAG: hypothetical protein WAN65_17850 [Candidatus Sulfotelmatobacter sp.]